MRELEIAFPIRVRAGEAASNVAEEFTLEELR